MKKHVYLSCICLLLLVSLATVPVFAATVTCPDSCSCMLPADAKKSGSPGYCSGKQAICGYDTQKNEKYCYEKSTTTAPPVIITGYHLVATTPTPVPLQKCASGCTCLSSADGKGKGLLYCGGKQVACGDASTPKYCFAFLTLATTPTPPKLVTEMHLPTTIPSSDTFEFPTAYCGYPCSCLLPDDATKKGLSYCGGKQTICTVSSGLSATGTSAPGQTRYCYTIPAATGSVTNISRVLAVNRTLVAPIPAPKKCPSGCSCLDEKTIRDKGYSLCSAEKTECGYSKTGGVLYCAKTGTASGPSVEQPGNIFSAIGMFFGSLFGGSPSQVTPVEGTSVLATYCQERYGPNFHMCNGACVDSLTDDNNCGGCGNWCNSDPVFNVELGTAYTCYNGQCVLQDDMAGSGPYTCGIGGSIDCPAGSSCLNGVCSALGCLDPDLTACNNICVSTSLDENNCGSCGNTCTLPNQSCRSGACHSDCDEPGTGYCRNFIDGVRYCAELDSDQSHCGRCQHSCDLSQLCSRGECVSECPTDLTHCLGGCVDTLTSEWNCGECGHRCDRDPSGRWRENCINGECWDPSLVVLPR